MRGRRHIGVFGLSIAVILDPEGHWITRLQGNTHWDSERAKASIGALVDGGGGS